MRRFSTSRWSSVTFGMRLVTRLTVCIRDGTEVAGRAIVGQERRQESRLSQLLFAPKGPRDKTGTCRMARGGSPTPVSP